MVKKTNKVAVVLSSGGLDSTALLATVVDSGEFDDIITVGFEYGQKHLKELDSSRAVAEYYGLEHHVLNLTQIFEGSDSTLITGDIQEGSYEQQIAEDGIVDSYVPFRNALMVSAAVSYGMSRFPGKFISVYLGVHAEDSGHAAYADTSETFVDKLCAVVYEGTYLGANVRAPFVNGPKSELAAAGFKLNAPLGLTWSCYNDGDKHCGTCATCIDRKKAFKDAGIEDPTEYEK